MTGGNLTCSQMVAYNRDMDNIFKALADSTRRQLLDQLFVKNGQTLSELCDRLEMTRQSVTKHLLLLEEAGLVIVEWHGRNKLHYLNAAPIGEIYDRWIGKYDRHRVEALRELKSKLEEDHHV
ncbi:ArsR/SmtB family transcription factor [Paenibacillus sp. NPDC056579]|uniref:ArsR/SmtB family transcription factor n=2 Tax=unclassified Paenibacillus TaxID=185978 RepID=UPI003694C74C